MIGVGIIGTGRMGNAHAGNLSKHPRARLVTAYDVNPAQMDAFVKKFPEVKPAATVEEVVNNPEVGFIVITSPTYCHAEGLRAAMATGKPIFCEKPLCRTAEELKELAPLISSYSSLFAVGFVRRYSAGGIKLLELVKAGKIGKPICCSIDCLVGGWKREWGDWFADYGKSGGCTLDMLAHHIDLANGLFGVPASVYARAIMMHEGPEKPYDYISATTTSKDGVICNMECSWLRSGPSDNYMVVYGEKGTLKKSDAHGLQFFAAGQPVENIPLDDVKVGELEEKVEGDMYVREMAAIIDGIENGHAPLAGAKQAIEAMKVALGMLESAEKGKVVLL